MKQLFNDYDSRITFYVTNCNDEIQKGTFTSVANAGIFMGKIIELPHEIIEDYANGKLSYDEFSELLDRIDTIQMLIELDLENLDGKNDERETFTCTITITDESGKHEEECCFYKDMFIDD